MSGHLRDRDLLCICGHPLDEHALIDADDGEQMPCRKCDCTDYKLERRKLPR